MIKKKPNVILTLVEQKGCCPCHHGHKVGDRFDFENDRGKLCPMALHVAFPYIDILRYGGKLPKNQCGDILFSCPDVDTLNIFKIELEESKDML